MQIDPSKIIVALDFDQRSIAEEFLSKVKKKVQVIKIGPVLFMKEGASFVNQVTNEGFEVFLDMKFHDIPNTVKGSVETACSAMKLKFLTIHASGGKEMVQAAKEAAQRTSPQTQILSVTVLTSLEEKDLRALGCVRSPQAQVVELAKLAIGAGSDGIVCSPQEIEAVRAQISKEAILVVPGIRSSQTQSKDDQKRTATAQEALQRGANYLVVGRPITQAKDPIQAFEEILQ